VRKLAQRMIELHDDVARLPGSTAVREKLVASALEYLDNLSRSAGRDADLLHELGDAYAKIASAQGAPGQPNLGRTEDALKSLRKAIDFQRRAAELNPAYSVQVADLQSHLAYLAMLSGRLPEARQNMQEAAARLDGLRASKPGDPELLMLAGTVALHQGDLVEYEGHSDDTLRYFQQARQFVADYVRIKPENSARARLHLISGLVATSLADNKRYDEALAVLHEADPIIDSLLAVEPDNPSYIRQKMAYANYESDIYYNESGSLNKPVESASAGRRYVALAQRLVHADPRNASARLSLAVANFQLSFPLAKIDPAESLRTAQTSIRIFDEDLARSPNDRLLRSRKARALRHLTYAFQANGQTVEARQAIDQAIAIQEQLLVETPGDASEREQVEFSKKARESLPAK
jgi:tetratricopeptide (TPR) repeat protein